MQKVTVGCINKCFINIVVLFDLFNSNKSYFVDAKYFKKLFHLAFSCFVYQYKIFVNNIYF